MELFWRFSRRNIDETTNALSVPVSRSIRWQDVDTFCQWIEIDERSSCIECTTNGSYLGRQRELRRSIVCALTEHKRLDDAEQCFR